ncbi:MAG: hypothetical protein ACREDH_06440 [Methylocella sp.]
MDMDNNSDAEELSDLIYSLEELRANPDIPVEALSALEQAHKIFLRNVEEEREIALQAYAYGLAMGAYFSPQEALPETDRLLFKVRLQSASIKIWKSQRRQAAGYALATTCKRVGAENSGKRPHYPRTELRRKLKQCGN